VEISNSKSPGQSVSVTLQASEILVRARRLRWLLPQREVLWLAGARGHLQIPVQLLPMEIVIPQRQSLDFLEAALR